MMATTAAAPTKSPSEFADFEHLMQPLWESAYARDSALILSGKAPLAIRNILDFQHRKTASYFLLFSEFYCSQKLKSEKIPYNVQIPLLPPFDPAAWNFAKAPAAQYLCRFGKRHSLLCQSALQVPLHLCALR